MKIIFFGLGSIGKRHLENMKSIMHERSVSVEIHAFRSRKKNISQMEGVQNIFEMNELDSDYDIAFVTNPTSLHFETLQSIKNKAKWVFIEKPIFEKVYTFESSLPANNYYVAAPLRYKEVMLKAKEIVANEKVLHARAICSSYLPNWRDEDYRESYSAQSSLGGGIELDCIHELDYAIHLFGLPRNTKSMIGKVSDLEISSNDTANYLLDYESKYIEIHVDYFGKTSIRKLELITDKDTYEFDLNNDTFTALTSEETIKYNEDRNDMYLKELYYFLDQVMTKQSNSNNLNHAIEVLKIAKGD